MQSVPQRILELIGRAKTRLVPLSPRGGVWQLLTGDCIAVLRCSRQTLGHVVWLHQFLDRLAANGFPAPKPLPLLNGSTIVGFEGHVWETLSFLPGRAMRLTTMSRWTRRERCWVDSTRLRLLSRFQSSARG